MEELTFAELQREVGRLGLINEEQLMTIVAQETIIASRDARIARMERLQRSLVWLVIVLIVMLIVAVATGH